MIVVVGAGLAGLSTALHLRDREVLVLEREAEVGGLARSVDAGGFLFDFTGHLLHLRSAEVRALVDELLGDDQVKLDRSAWIQLGAALLPYPFQVNTWPLPAAVRAECLEGFAESLLPENRLPEGGFAASTAPPPLSFLDVKEPTGGYRASFHDWIVATFGRGFAKHFFLDYNAKNFAAEPDTIASDWVSWAIPKPSLEEVVRGALGPVAKEFGYNPRFRYPASGGIRRLPDAMAARLGNVRRRATVTAIDARAKTVTLADGATLRYDALVATNPLPELLAMTTGLAPEAYEAVRALRWCAVASFNFGLDRPFDHARHWVYFPERKYRFYRVGYPSHLAPSMAPPGTASVCAEVAYAPGAFPPPPDEEERVLAELVAAGVIPDPARVVVRRRLDLPYAYVLFDDARRRALRTIFPALLAADVIPVGRYGAWNYLSMEDTILQGRETAEFLRRA